MSRNMARAGRICDVKPCGDPVFARHWCRRHYNQVARYGKIVRIEHRQMAKRKTKPARVFDENLEHRVQICRDNYNNACGLDARMRTKAALVKAEREFERIKKGAA